VISVALTELGCPSLDYVYRMSWAEFQLRLIGFNRSEERQEKKLRRLAWVSYIAPHQNPKKLRGLKEDRWWRIGNKDVVRVSDADRARFLVEYKKYLDKKEHGRA